MKHYCIVFILTAVFKPCLGMEIPFSIPEILQPNSKGNLLLVLTLHNDTIKKNAIRKQQKPKLISILDENAQGPNVLCHIDFKFINGKDKSSFELERELQFYEKQFNLTPPASVVCAPNKMWINCISAFNASNFSFNPEGRFMFNRKVLTQNYRNKKLTFESFAGKSISITKISSPYNIYKAVFKDWDDVNYLLYIDGRNNIITDRYPS